MQLKGHDIGICTWSLQPKGMQDLAAKVKQLGLEHVQLALIDLVMLDDKRKYEELGHLRLAEVAEILFGERVPHVRQINLWD